jgi:hypothetical protein
MTDPASDASHDTNRLAFRDALAASGVSPQTAERWCAAWEFEAAILGLTRNSDYWALGHEWIAAQVRARRPGWR